MVSDKQTETVLWSLVLFGFPLWDIQLSSAPGDSCQQQCDSSLPEFPHELASSSISLIPESHSEGAGRPLSTTWGSQCVVSDWIKPPCEGIHGLLSFVPYVKAKRFVRIK